jgi:hypothetical protein
VFPAPDSNAKSWYDIADASIEGFPCNKPLVIITAPVARVAPVVSTTPLDKKPAPYNPKPAHTASKTCECYFTTGSCPHVNCFFLHKLDGTHPINWTFNHWGPNKDYWTAKTGAKWRHWYDFECEVWHLQYNDGTNWRESNASAYFDNLQQNGSL